MITHYNRDTCSRVLDDLMENGLRVEFEGCLDQAVLPAGSGIEDIMEGLHDEEWFDGIGFYP